MNYLINSSIGELYHHGIKGQKWGVRRYRNKDGSLTVKGKRRYSEDAERVRQLKKKKAYELSNKELQEIQNRNNLERSYRQSKQGYHEKLVEKTLSKIGEKTTEKIATAVVAAGSAYVTYLFLKK